MSEQNNWAIHTDPAQTHEAARQLEAALAEENPALIASILAQPHCVRSLTVRLGEKGHYIKMLRQAFRLLAAETGSDPGRLTETYGLDIFLLAEIMAVAFHLRDQALFYELFLFFDRNQARLQDTEAYLFALNAFASWEGSINGNHEKNLDINRKILESARRNNFPVMEQKAKFALSDHKFFKTDKPLDPKLRIKDFTEMAEVFRRHSIEYDALRADIESLDSQRLIIAKTTNARERAHKLDTAIDQGKQLLARIKKIDYPKALIRAKTIMAQLYTLSAHPQTALRLEKETLKLKDKYDIS